MLYILHFSQPIGDLSNPKGQARHYTGACADDRLHDRLLEHRNGLGAKLTRAAIERGIRLEIGAAMPGAYDEERALKLMHNGPRYCRYCREARLLEKLGL